MIFLPVFPTEILGKLKEGSLKFRTNESKFLGLQVNVLEGSGVDCD